MTSRKQDIVGERFVVEREMGRGGVGIVYRAFDPITEQHVALKVIAIAGVDAAEEARFNREGLVLAGLSHPGIVRLVAFGQLDSGAPYVAMEWLEGEDIAQRQKRSPLTSQQSLTIAANIADALAAAHAAGIVHRDVKPSNIFLVEPEGGGPGALPIPKLVDFGGALADDARLTHTGIIVGTPAYMAPEQAKGDSEVDARADLYGLGATLFEMIAGRPPHVGPTPIAILARLVTTPAPRLSEVVEGVPYPLDDLMSRLLATAPEDRPAHATLVAKELRFILSSGLMSEQPLLRSTTSRRSLIPMSIDPRSEPSSPRHQAGGSRLVTSIVATHVPKGASRGRLLTLMRARGADATELGGDAIIAHLGVERALGDEAVRALDLALRVAATSATVGIASGRTRLDQIRSTGEVVDRAAALARDAQRGQVIADTTTSELARGRYAFQMRGDGAVVVGDAVQGKIDVLVGAPFVGRETELAQVIEAFERSVEDSTPVVVTITGTPGIGKTRLRREAVARIGSHAAAPRVIFARAQAFARSQALGVVAEIARGLAGTKAGVTLEDARRATELLVAKTGVDATKEVCDLVARLIANETFPHLHDSRGARDALWIVMTDIVVALCDRTPLVFGLEDAQWADVESLAWFDHLLARAGGRRLCILVTARPGLWRDEPERFVTRDHVRIELRPLARKTVRLIAAAMLGDRAEGDAGQQLTESIASQAGGSPLFAEELARLAAQGRNAATAPTIEAAMQSHLDALDDVARKAAGAFAVFGLAGWDVGLHALGVPSPFDVLRALASAEILVESATSRFKDTREWSFKHALMREVAYSLLGDDALRELHAKAGRWLLTVGEDDATVARHLELGGDHRAAAEYLEKAARRALAANSLAQAVEMAERALAFAEDKPSQFARALVLDEAWNRLDARAAERVTAIRALADAVYDHASLIRANGAQLRYEDACGGERETAARLDEVRRMAKEAGLIDEEARCAAALASRYAFTGEVDQAAQVAEELLDLAKHHSIAGAAVDGWQTLAVVQQARGDVGAALEARRSAARSASEANLKSREATLTINVGFALTTLGARTEARASILKGLALAQAIGSPGTERHGKMILLCWTATFGLDPTLDVLLSEPRAMADAAVGGTWVPHDRATLGAIFYRGAELLATATPQSAKHAQTLLRIAAQGYRATRMLDVLPVSLGLWAQSEQRCGHHQRARDIAREAVDLLEEGSPSLLNEAPVYLALHDACIDLGFLQEAREAVVKGIPRLMRRLEGLRGTGHAQSFLRELVANSDLLGAAEAYDLVPDTLQQLIAQS